MLGITLQPEQERILREVLTGDEVQSVLFAGGVGAAKSWLAALALLIRVLAPVYDDELTPPDKKSIYWIASANYLTPRQIFGYVRSWLQELFGSIRSVTMPSEGAWALSFELPDKDGKPLQHVLIETVSTEEMARLHSVPVQMIIISEAAQVSDQARAMLVGRTTRAGVIRGFIWEEGTLEGDAAVSSWTRRVYEAIQVPRSNVRAYCFPSWFNRAKGSGQEGLDEEDIAFLEDYCRGETTFTLQDKRLEKLRQDCPNLYLAITAVSQPLFASRYGAIPTPSSGIVFREFSPGVHMKKLSWLGGRVDITIDPGVNDPYAILVIQEREVDGLSCLEVIDGFYRPGMTTEAMIIWVLDHWLDYWKNLRYLVVDPIERDARGMWANSYLYNLRSVRRPIVYGVKTATKTWIEVVHRWLVHPATKRPRLFFDDKLTFISREMSLYASPQPRDGQEMRGMPRAQFDHALTALGNYLVAVHGAAEYGVGRKTRRGLVFSWE